MKLIFCVDKKGGMMFFSKRQSQDSVLRQKLIEMTSGNKLIMSEYSKGQFKQFNSVIVSDDYLDIAGESDYCFIENLDYDINRASEVILCNWNRQYQADKFFNCDLKKLGFKKVASENIKGSSHDKITIETYRR